MTMRALLWDLDGTLLDTEHLWLSAETDVMARHGFTWGEEDQRHCLGGPIERVTEYMATHVTDGAPAALLAAELLDSMESHLLTDEPRWRPGAVELIEQAKKRGMHLALVTASHRRLLDALDRTLEQVLALEVGMPAPIFDTTVAGDELPVTKPDPAPYLEAARRLGVDITECVVIEDSPTGVASGLASGAPVLAVPHLSPITAHPRIRIMRSLVDVDVLSIQEWHDQVAGGPMSRVG